MGQLSLFKGRRQRGVVRPSAREDKLHFIIADVLLRWHRQGWNYTHIPTGELRTKATAARLKRMGVQPGWPDFILLSPTGVTHFLELKRYKRGLSDAQEDFADYCNTHNYPHAVTDTFNDTLAVLKHWCAVRVNISA